jgi:NAD(P)-dependent dehydrogenase (short-subunit alcohol dehydrogenase family)
MQTYDEMSAGDFRKVVDINLTGTFLMTKAITPLMRGRGWIAFGPELFSVLVRVPGPTFSVKPRITRR